MAEDKELSPEVRARIGRILKAAREKLGLTQKQVGAKVGKSEATVSRVEAGIAELTVSQAYFLAEALKIPSITVMFELDRPRMPESALLRDIGARLDRAMAAMGIEPPRDPADTED